MTYRIRTLVPIGCLVLLPACPPSGSSDETGTATDAVSASDTGTAPGTGTDPDPTGAPTTGTTGQDVTGEPDTTSTGTTTTGPGTTTDLDTDTDTDGTGPDPDPDTDTDTTGEPPPAECLLPAGPVAPYFTTEVVNDIDETCFVSKSVLMGDDLALEFTCPVAGKVAFTLHSGPKGEPFPTEGETFEVYYQQEFADPLELPRMGLLVLRNGDKLRYGVASGFLFPDADFGRLAAAVLPMTLSVESGPCPHVPTFEDEPHSGDSWICNYEALALVRLAVGDTELLQGEGGAGMIMSNGDLYTLDVRLARRGEQCIDFTLDRVTFAIAGQNFR